MTITTDLKKFAQAARRQLRDEVARRLEQVLHTDSAELREKKQAIRELQDQITRSSKAAVIDRVAYTWFNRFCSLRFMDVNRYTRLGVVSPAEGFSQPEILQEAKRGYMDDDLQRYVDRQAVFALLNGQRPSSDPQGEAYRLLLVGVCNSYNPIMPFMFEKIADYTELLMPLDLLSEHSVLNALREVMTADNCQDVEIIGWLYQYYISERKDEVFEALKNNQKIEARDIPAATQLFTPHWIVRYLVENSLGRLWLLNRPSSKLAEKMDYYIKSVQEETDFLRISSPEEIKLNDPACGSGHMLTYSFDLLYAIYEEEGYPAAEIPRLILEKNLYGIEIDPRAGALAAFALFMKARSKDRRFFSRPVQPNICVLQNVKFTDQELDDYISAVGRDLFTEPLRQTLKQFEQADNFGSLICPALADTAYVRQMLQEKNLGGNIFLYNVHERVLQVLKQAEYLAPRYHVIVTNPPYMGSGGMNSELKNYARSSYQDSSMDTYAMFMERGLEMLRSNGFLAMITIPNWMFLSSFECLRKSTFTRSVIASLIDNGRGVFGSDFGSCSFILEKKEKPDSAGLFKRLFVQNWEVNSNHDLNNRFLNNIDFPVYRASITQLKKIPGWPVAYWVTDRVRLIFEEGVSLDKLASIGKGLDTGDNTKFLRYWFEPARDSPPWIPCQKGGPYRKWYGNHEYVVFWEDNGRALKASGGNLRNSHNYFKPGISWTRVSPNSSFRYFPKGFIFESTGPSLFPYDAGQQDALTAFLNSKLTATFLKFIAPAIDFQSGHISQLPIFPSVLKNNSLAEIAKKCIEISTSDWDSFERSWDFKNHPIQSIVPQPQTLQDAYFTLRNQWNEKVKAIHKLEEENNYTFIETYGLYDELTPDVPLEEITLTCNPHYRYGGKRNEEEMERLLRADTMREFISYAVGCMFGRYSLDKPGLILANQGETIEDYRRQMAEGGVQWDEVQFIPDEDNAIPVLDGDWFSDDTTERFKKFLRVTFGEEHYTENLAFIEEAIGRDIRSYFVKDFYGQHLKMYKKRPIYWLFSSPQGSFNVLIYMHRYTPDTVSVILNRYLREFRSKLEARRGYLEQISINASATPREKTAAIKEIEKLNKTLEELRVYEREILFPLATQRLVIDLDDGVKVNYAKFGKALAKIPGL